jgi:sugar O-acyltransferase (sialic acid O-acetyltransferase NeuD family)
MIAARWEIELNSGATGQDMSKPKKIIILGTGGNSVDILDTIGELNLESGIKAYECLGFLDDNPEALGRDIAGAKVIGPLSAANDFPDAFFVNGIGSPSNFWKKSEIIEKTGVRPDRFETIVHPSASVSKLATLGRGVVILQNVTIASFAKIGNHVIVLPASVISHDAEIGNYTCIAAGVCISGSVEVGESCYLGTNSSLISNIRVGNHSLIGMGGVVLKNVPENKVAAGCPARVIRDTR